MGQEQTSDPEMGFGACFLGDQRIGRLLDAVMLECIGVLQAEHQPGSNGLPKTVVKLI
jgi:hypothetical protein